MWHRFEKSVIWLACRHSYAFIISAGNFIKQPWVLNSIWCFKQLCPESPESYPCGIVYPQGGTIVQIEGLRILCSCLWMCSYGILDLRYKSFIIITFLWRRKLVWRPPQSSCSLLVIESMTDIMLLQGCWVLELDIGEGK